MMKKLLLISTILAVTSGAASADIAFSGDARMGLASTDGGKTFTTSNRMRVKIAGSGETDDALKFGASMRSTQASDGSSTLAMQTTFIESAKLGKISFGDADGAAQSAVTQFVAIGFDDTKKYQEFKFLTGGSTSTGVDMIYNYTNGPIGVAVSMGEAGSVTYGDDRAAGLSYTTEFWKLAVGFEDDGTNSQSIVSGSIGNGQVDLKVAYGVQDDAKDQYVAYGTYIIGNTTLTAFARKDLSDVNYQGFGVNHELGGGLALSAGYAKKDATDSVISIGALMTF